MGKLGKRSVTDAAWSLGSILTEEILMSEYGMTEDEINDCNISDLTFLRHSGIIFVLNYYELTAMYSESEFRELVADEEISLLIKTSDQNMREVNRLAKIG